MGRDGRNYRERLLTSATELLKEKGSLNITARELVNRSGANLASIGYHFGSKDALLDEAVLRMTTQMTSIAESAAGDDAPLAQRLACSLISYDDQSAGDTAWFSALARLSQSPELAAGLSAHYVDAHKRILLELPGSGCVDASALSWLVVALADGLLVQRLILGETAISEAQLAAALAVLVSEVSGPAKADSLPAPTNDLK